MAMTNEELIQKAVITTDALAAGGKLSPIQSKQFVTTLVDLTELTGNVRVVRFTGESLQIDKIGVGKRVTVPKAEATAEEVRRGVTTGKVTLTPKEQMTPFEISDDFPEQCIEGESVENTVIRLMATQTSNDLEELYLNADLLGRAQWESDLFDDGSTTKVIKDRFLAQFNGWLRVGDSGHIYDAEDADISSTIFSRMLMAMPKKFRRVRRNLRYLASMDHEQLYREKVGARQTPAGDRAQQTIENMTPYGIPLVGVPLMDFEPYVVEHVTLGAHPDTQSLTYGPIGTEVIVTLQTLNKTPTTPATETTDYVVDRTAEPATITTTAAGAFAAGAAVKVTYQARGMMLLTDYQNLILAISRDVRIERAREIFRGVDQFAITTKVSINVEEATAIVKGINIGLE